MKLQEDIRGEKKAENKGIKKLKKVSLLGKCLGNLFTFLVNLIVMNSIVKTPKLEYFLLRLLVLVVMFGPDTFFLDKNQ